MRLGGNDMSDKVTTKKQAKNKEDSEQNRAIERKNNTNSKEALRQELFVTINDHDIKSSGAGLMTSMFKKLAEKVTEEAKEELAKPKYRFFKYNFPEEETVDVYSNLNERYNVKVFDNGTEYVIRLFKERLNSKNEFEVDDSFTQLEYKFEAYKSVTRDYSFDDIKFWEDRLTELGESNSEVANACAVKIKEYLDKLTGSRTWLNYKEHLEKKLAEKEYEIKIFENLEAKNIEKEQRYFIRLYKGNVYIDYDLVKYREQILDFDFDEEEFWEEKIGKLLGGNSTESAEYAKVVAEYLSNVMYFREFYSLRYKEIGWDTYTWDKKEWIFKYDELYSRRMLISGNLMTEIEGINAVDDNIKNKLDWTKFATKLINENPVAALLVGAGVSGMLRSKLAYTKETNININIFGGPASGKSTIGHFILSIFGNPMFIEGSFTDTDNSMEENRIKRPIMPYILDERMLKHVGTTKGTKVSNIIMDIFREYEGKVKERTGKQYEELSGKRTFGPVMSSSVESILEQIYGSEADLGQYRRFIELRVGKEKDVNTYRIFSNENDAKMAEQYAYYRYGYGVRMMIEYMLYLINEKSGDILQERFDALDNEISIILENDSTEKTGKLTSSSKRFALIVLSYQIFYESIQYFIYNETLSEIERNQMESEEASDLFKKYWKMVDGKDVDGFIAESIANNDKKEEIIKILVENLKAKMFKVNELEVDFDSKLWDWVKTNNDLFYESTSITAGWEEAIGGPDKFIGKIVTEKKTAKKKDDKPLMMHIVTQKPYELYKLLMMNPIPASEVFIKYISIFENESKVKAKQYLLEQGINIDNISDQYIERFKKKHNKWDIKEGNSVEFCKAFKNQRAYLISKPIITAKEAEGSED